MRFLVGLAIAVLVTDCSTVAGTPGPAAPAAAPAAFATVPPAPASSSAAPDPCRHASTVVATRLPVAGFGRIVADPGSCQVFVSSPQANSIVVLDYSGAVVTTISNEYGAGAMVVSGPVLYVALTGTGAIDEIDVRTLGRIKTLASGLVKPADLALAGGRLWTTSGVCAQWSVKLVSVDPATGAMAQFDPDTVTSLPYCIRFAVSTANTNVLVAWDDGLEPANLTALDVSTGTPAVVRTQREEILGNLGDAVITTSNRIVTASGAPYEFDQWKMSDLQQDGVVYPGSPYPVAVATAAGWIVTGCAFGMGPNVPAIQVFPLDRPAPVASFLPGGSGSEQLYRRGLALSPDGTVVFAVTGVHTPDQDVLTLRVLPVG